jgi:hypothetical protein
MIMQAKAIQLQADKITTRPCEAQLNRGFVSRLVRTNTILYGHYHSSRSRSHIRGPANPYALMQYASVYDTGRPHGRRAAAHVPDNLFPSPDSNPEEAFRSELRHGKRKTKNSKQTGAITPQLTRFVCEIYLFRPVPLTSASTVVLYVHYSKEQPQGTLTVHVNLQYVRGQRASIDKLCREPCSVRKRSKPEARGPRSRGSQLCYPVRRCPRCAGSVGDGGASQKPALASQPV